MVNASTFAFIPPVPTQFRDVGDPQPIPQKVCDLAPVICITSYASILVSKAPGFSADPRFTAGESRSGGYAA
jgi:hypothetical protein